MIRQNKTGKLRRTKEGGIRIVELIRRLAGKSSAWWTWVSDPAEGGKAAIHRDHNAGHEG